jgi:uncharacterized protein (TIGR03083 family)
VNATGVSLMDLAVEERVDLAAYLSALAPPHWQQSSLCAGWSVKDVVAHVVSYEDLNVVGLARRFVKGRIIHANDVGVEELAPLSPEELVDFLKRHLHPRGLTAGFGGMIALVDATIHHQDIRRALGHPRTVPTDRLERILPLVPGNPRLGARRRIKGLRLQAADVDWRHGDGPEVAGTGEALLMAMAGRKEAVAELSGPGQPVLAARML